MSPLPPGRRHPADYRDEIEHLEVAAVIAELPDDHPARVAYCSAAREGAHSIGLGHLLTDRMDLVERLTAAYLGHGRRIDACYNGAAHLAGGRSG